MTPVFPTELLKLVASEAGAVDRKLVYSLLLVSKAFYSFATPIFYESIVVGDVDCSDKPHHHHSHLYMGPHTRMRFNTESLNSLHLALTQSSTLSSYIQTFVVINKDHSTDIDSPPFFFFPNDHDLWERLGHIFATLKNIKYFSISPSRLDSVTPLQKLPSSVAITHLSTDNYPDYQDVFEFLERPSQRHAIRYLRVLEHHDPLFRPNPPPSGRFENLHTIYGYPQLWYIFVKNGAPIEHLATELIHVIDFIDPALVFHGTRTLEMSSWNREALSAPLPHLKSIELLYVTLTMCDDKIPLEDFLAIPSMELKYIRIDSSEDHEKYAEELLGHFPSLMLLEFQRIGEPTPLRRYTRRKSPAGLREVTRKEIHRLRGNPSYPPVFMSWWDLLETDFKDVGLEFQPLKGENV